jgi:RNA polymerase sigma factor (sigma-70 family)
MISSLLPILLGRCEAILKAKIRADDLDNAEEVREEILGDFSVLFAADAAEPDSGNTLDFFECRFNLAFRRFRLPYIQRERERAEPLISRPSAPESSDELTDDEFLSQLSEAGRTPANQDTYVLRHTLLRAIDTLPLDQRDAVMLRYFYELPEESENPSVRSVASVCGVTGRTIRNRINRALARLSKQLNQRGRTRNEFQQRSGTSD